MPELAHFPAYVRTGCVRTYAAIDPKHAYRRDKRKRQGTTAMVIPCLCSFLLTVLSSASAGTCRGEAPPSCCARPFCRLKAPLGLSLLRCARKRGTCRGGAPPSCCARPFCRLKAPLGLSLLRCARKREYFAFYSFLCYN